MNPIKQYISVPKQNFDNPMVIKNSMFVTVLSFISNEIEEKNSTFPAHQTCVTIFIYLFIPISNPVIEVNVACA